MVGSSYCYAHDPALAEVRSRNGAKGGRLSGRGRSSRRELAAIKREIREVVEEVRTKKLEPRIGGVVFQGYNTLLKAYETEQRQTEQDELLEKLEELEELVPAPRARGRRGWDAGTAL